MSLLDLPEPPGWGRSRRFVALAAILGFCTAVAYLYWAVTAAMRGSYLTVAVASGPAAFLVSMLVALPLVLAGRTNPRITADATGFTVLPHRRFSMLILAGVVAFIPSGVLFGVLAPLGRIDLALNTGMRILGPIATGIVTFICIAGLASARRRGSVGHVKLTPAMVENADILSTRMLEWDDVIDVADHATTRKAPRAVVLRLRDGREEIIAPADIYVPGELRCIGSSVITGATPKTVSSWPTTELSSVFATDHSTWTDRPLSFTSEDRG